MYPWSTKEYIKDHQGVHDNKRHFKFTWAYQDFKIDLPTCGGLVPSNARTIMPFGQIMKLSTPTRLRVMARQTFRGDPLSIITLEMVILLHSTAICRDLTCPVPSGLSSSSLKVIVLIPRNLFYYLFEVFCCEVTSFKLFNSASRCASEDSKRTVLIFSAGNSSTVPLEYVLL